MKMKNVINKIFSGLKDDDVHAEFIKFSRGIFNNRYLVEGKKQKDKWAIKTSSEFVNSFVREILEKTRENIKIKGIIISTSDLEEDCEIPIEDIKKYMGIKQFIFDCEISPEKILNLMEKHPRAFYAISFSTPKYDLKIKAKPPKSAKPGTSTKNDGRPKADFCSLKTNDKEIINNLFFDFPHFNEILIKHTIQIDEIEIPKDAKTPEQVREKAIRKGVVKRFIDVDGKEHFSQKEFVA